MLEVKGLRSGYVAVEVLRGVDISISEGEVVALLGSNGVGKTTFASIVSGLDRPWAGSVRFKGEEITGLSPQAIVIPGCVSPSSGPMT